MKKRISLPDGLTVYIDGVGFKLCQSTWVEVDQNLFETLEKENRDSINAHNELFNLRSGTD